MLQLEATATDALTMDAAALRPDAFGERAAADVAKAPVWVGNRAVEAGELFRISGDPRDGRWRFEGDLSRVQRLGARMTAGEIHAAGPVGRHAGAQMRGGRLTIDGDAGDWLGAQMRGGRIEVHGAAGDLVGAAYRGSPLGMRGGEIRIRGGAGSEAGAAMRRGLITIGGGCGELAGYRMRAGTIVVLGDAGPRAGAEMIRGTIGLFGHAPALPPTFRAACVAEPQFLRLLAKRLRLELPQRVRALNGDLLTGGRGEILTRATEASVGGAPIVDPSAPK